MTDIQLVQIDRVMLGEDGLPGVLAWLHVDDLLLHGTTSEKVGRALTLGIYEALQMGLIYQKNKMIPPCQVMRSCGFDYNTTGIPTLCITPEKVSKALSFIDFLDRRSQELQTKKLAWLTLSVVVGVLQSLLDATPANIVASFLRGLYADLHSLDAPELRKIRVFYFTTVELSEASILDLRW